MDITIVNVAIPSIQQGLHSTPAVIEWISLGYLLPVSALALPSGRWLDRVGKRAMLVFAAGGFGLASFACGLAPTIEVLIGARIVQGIFGAVLFAMTPTLATIAVRPEARGRALSVPTTLGPVGAAAGPALGGLIVSTLGWQWIFFVNVPVCVVIILLGFSQLTADGPLHWPGRDWLVEAFLLGLSVTALLVGLTFVARGGLGWLAVSAFAAVPLVIWLRLPLSKATRQLLGSGGVAAPLIGLVAIMATVGFVQYLTPFFLTEGLHLSPAKIGLTMLGFPVMMALIGPVAGAIADRWGVRAPLLVGAALAVIGLALLVPLDRSWTQLDVVWRLAVFGLGLGLYAGPNQTSVMSAAPRPMLGTAGASSSLLRQLGLSLGPAVATLVWSLSGYSVSGMSTALVIAAVAALAAGLTAVFRAPISR